MKTVFITEIRQWKDTWIDATVSHVTTSKKKAIELCKRFKINSTQWWSIYEVYLNTNETINSLLLLDHNNNIIYSQPKN